jgi:hypothetical protein
MINKTDGTCDIPAHAWVIDEITAERQRQIDEEGWSPEHDDAHTNGELAKAAACYAWIAAQSDGVRSLFGKGHPPPTWPDSWDGDWWKPSTRRRDLIKSTALNIAEIERLDRLAARETDNG